MNNFKNMFPFLSGRVLLVSTPIVPTGAVVAQDEGGEDVPEEIATTGTPISNQYVIAASPIMLTGESEIRLLPPCTMSSCPHGRNRYRVGAAVFL